jgi:hypothetical protein
MIRVLLATFALTLAAPAMANEVDDIVRSYAANDVPAFTALLKAEVGKGSIDSNFYIDPTALRVYVQPRVDSDLFGHNKAVADIARTTGRSICEAMSRSQHDRSFFLAWKVDIMAWRGAVGDSSSGYDPVLRCKLGGAKVSFVDPTP